MHCTLIFSISNLKLVHVAHVNTAQQLLGITAKDAAVPILFIFHHSPGSTKEKHFQKQNEADFWTIIRIRRQNSNFGATPQSKNRGSPLKISLRVPLPPS